MVRRVSLAFVALFAAACSSESSGPIVVSASPLERQWLAELAGDWTIASEKHSLPQPGEACAALSHHEDVRGTIADDGAWSETDEQGTARAFSFHLSDVEEQTCKANASTRALDDERVRVVVRRELLAERDAETISGTTSVTVTTKGDGSTCEALYLTIARRR